MLADFLTGKEFIAGQSKCRVLDRSSATTLATKIERLLAHWQTPDQIRIYKQITFKGFRIDFVYSYKTVQFEYNFQSGAFVPFDIILKPHP